MCVAPERHARISSGVWFGKPVLSVKLRGISPSVRGGGAIDQSPELK